MNNNMYDVYNHNSNHIFLQYDSTDFDYNNSQRLEINARPYLS